MHPLDIISNSPNLYILRKESNKTNFGGFLFLIYLIIIITIFVYYIIDYTKNDKYIIQSFNHFNIKSDKEEEERNKNDFYNPTINFTLDIEVFFKGKYYNLDYEKFSTNLKIYYNKTEKFIERRSWFSTKINDFHIYILYECDNLNCSDYFEQKKNLKEEFDISSYYLYFAYDGFTLDHQNENKPIIKTEDNGRFFFRRYNLNFNKTTDIRNKWENILYTEKKGYFQKDSSDSCGYIESYNSYYYDIPLQIRLNGMEDKAYILVSEFTFNNDNTQYIEYFRKRVSELDLLANFLSLVANIFTGVKFIFSFYSSNFNNFKIIEKILNRQPKKNYKINNNPLEMEDYENKKFISIRDDFSENNIQKDIEKTESNNDSDFHKFKDDDCDDDKSSTDSKRIKKLHFFDFFLNNIYCCLKKKKPQKIIHKCNQIIEKYASIDMLIKNQILIENLLKDYKWNDPNLNNVENNNLFVELKTYL